MPLLHISGLEKKIGQSFALHNISFDLEKSQKIAIAGETGSGKSTLMKIIGGLVQKGAGDVLFEGNKIIGPDDQLIPGHPGIAYLSQHYELRNHYRVEELMDMANQLTDEEAMAIYDVCRVSHLLTRRTDQLSGGEKQRIVMAKTLVTKPRLLLLDEPFSNMDLIHKNLLKQVLQDIGDKLQITCMLSSHDPYDYLPWADEVIVIKDGNILQQATPQHIYSHPVNEYVAGLMGRYNLVSPATLALLPGAPKTETNEEVFIRPENFKIVPNEHVGIKAKVKTVSFYGSFYELEVQIADTSLIVKTIDCTAKEGDEIFIAIR